MLTAGSIKCVVVAAMVGARVACASDVETVRKWLVEEAARAQSDKLEFCVDVSWTKYTAPMYSDEEFTRRWQSAVNRPDHPDKYLLLMDLAKREGDVGSPIRVLYKSRDMLRISSKAPVLKEEMIFGAIPPLESMEKAVELGFMQRDQGTASGQSWQSTDSSIAVMSADNPTYNPGMMLDHHYNELYCIIFGGIELNSPAAWKRAEIKVRRNHEYEVTFSSESNGLSKDWTYEIAWSDQYNRGFVQRHTAKAIISNEDRVMRNTYLDWTPADGGGSFFAARSIVQEGGRPKEGQTSPAVLKEKWRIETSSAAVADCDFVEKTSKAPEVKDSKDGFVVLDPVRGEWLAVRQGDIDRGLQRVIREPGKLVEEPVRVAGVSVAPKASLLKNPLIWVVTSILGVGAIAIVIRHRNAGR